MKCIRMSVCNEIFFVKLKFEKFLHPWCVKLFAFSVVFNFCKQEKWAEIPPKVLFGCLLIGLGLTRYITDFEQSFKFVSKKKENRMQN